MKKHMPLGFKISKQIKVVEMMDGVMLFQKNRN